MTHALLLQPPAGDLTGPYPALPYIKSYAEQQGYRVRVRDLGIEALHFLSREDKLRSLLQRADDIRTRLEGKRFLGPDEQVHYGLLLPAMGLGLEPNLMEKAFQVFRDPDRFYDYRPYKESCRFLEAFYRMLSAVHFPTILNTSEYPPAQAFGPMKNILTHCDRRLNPFVDYYEEALFPYVAEESPSVIGISMVFASQSTQALVLGNLLKQRFPEIHITMGGAYFSQWLMLMGEVQLVQLFSCTDSAVCGEGEKPFSNLLERVLGKQPLDGSPNLIHRSQPKGEIRRFSELEYTDITTQPPPDFSDLDMDAYLIPRTIIPYCISRGCYWGKCAFCQNRYGEYHTRKYQTVPVEKAIEEMSRMAEQYRTNHFNFSNDVIDPPYLERFSKSVIAGGKGFVWNTDLRAEEGFTPDLCQLMARAGLNAAAIGFESSCQKVLDAMDKGNRVGTTRQVFKNLYDAGIATQAMGIFGFPGEAEKDGLMTVRFLEENIDRISYYVMGLLMVLPGSRMHKDPNKYGIESISYPGNPMMTPMPVWTSNIRMSLRSVNRLYDRLSQLENLYVINDYPYLGALSTNHGFLYFELGPDILKRLRAKENRRHSQLHRIMGVDEGHRPSRNIKSAVPHRTVLPFTIYRSPFPYEKLPMDPESPPAQARLLSGEGADYLIDPINMPLRVEETERKILGRIDGKRKLKTILLKHLDDSLEQSVSFMMKLISRGLIDVVKPKR